MSLVALSPNLTDAVRARPETTDELAFDPSEDEAMASSGFSIVRTLPEAPSGRICLEKDWHLIHFILTKQPWAGDLPLGFLLAGEEIGEDTGYGPGRLVSSEQVSEINRALADLDFVAMARRVSAADNAKAELYGLPGDLSDKSVAEFVLPSFNALREFVSAAAQNGRSIYMSIE